MKDEGRRTKTQQILRPSSFVLRPSMWHHSRYGMPALDQRQRQRVRAPAGPATARRKDIAGQQDAQWRGHALAVIANPWRDSAYSSPLWRLLSVTNWPRS